MSTIEQAILAKIEELQDEMIQDMLKVVRIDSVKGEPKADAPFGEGPKKALEQALAIASSLGFETVNMDNYIGYATYGKGEDYIGVIGHLDVVEPKEGWTHPPFGGEIENGRIFARGILDNKGPIMSCLYALYALKELHIPLTLPIRILFGTDEESGFADAAYYLTKTRPPIMGWTPDCKYPVVYGERGRATITIQTAKTNIRAFFDFVNTYFLESNRNGDRLGIHFKDTAFGEMQMRGYHLEETKDALQFRVTLSYPASCTMEDILKQIQFHCDFTLLVEKHYPPVCFEKDCRLVKTLQEAYETVTGFDGTPVTTTGGTYAKIIPHIVPFGPSFPGQKGIGHQPDEWMDIKDILCNAKIYAISLYRLAT